MKYSRFFRVWTIAVILMIALVIDTPVTVNAERIILKVGPGHPYATIQDAVDDASPGSNIYVYPLEAPGPYYYNESVSITKNDLQIIAQDSGVTVHSPNEGVPTFTVHADHVVIRGFDELTGVYLTTGIDFEGSYNTFADNIINPGSAPGINAISCRTDDGGSNFNRIENNTIVHADIGIAVIANLPTSALNVGNIIKNNKILGIAQNGISVANGIRFTITGNNIPQSPFGDCIGVTAYNNEAQGYHHITDNTVAGCSGNGGIALYADDNTKLSNNYVAGNEISSSSGNGIFLYADPAAKVINNSIINNKVSDSGGTGLYLTSGVDSNIIIKNSFMRNGSFGIAVSGNRNLFWDNTALENGEFDLADWGTNNIWINNKYETAYLHPIFLPLIMLVQPG